VQGRRSLQGRRSNGDVARRVSLNATKRRQEESLLAAFDEDDAELGLNRVSEEEEDSVETLPENHHHAPQSLRS
jgi:hypothetical protein